MSDLLAARSQMAVSLAFHIIFACIGIAMPVLMVLAERRWQRTGDAAYLDLAKRWAKGTAILFAVGAVSGTVLSFELGLLWPRFMQVAGAIIGMPFSLEGFAFFTEAIFLGIYLYGWERVPPRMHLLAGVLVAVSGAASGVFVVIANAWMNTPIGFTIEAGSFTHIDPIYGRGHSRLSPAQESNQHVSQGRAVARFAGWRAGGRTPAIRGRHRRAVRRPPPAGEARRHGIAVRNACGRAAAIWTGDRDSARAVATGVS